MKKFLETLINIYKIEELRNRIGVTLTILLIYRFGAQITLPGIDAVQLAELGNRTGGGGLLGVLNMFTGGAFANASVFALGIMPYISASIVVQLMGIAIPYLQKLQKEGESGRKTLNPDHTMVNYCYLCCASSSIFVWTRSFGCARFSFCFRERVWLYGTRSDYFSNRYHLCYVAWRKNHR